MQSSAMLGYWFEWMVHISTLCSVWMLQKCFSCEGMFISAAINVHNKSSSDHLPQANVMLGLRAYVINRPKLYGSQSNPLSYIRGLLF